MSIFASAGKITFHRKKKMNSVIANTMMMMSSAVALKISP